MGENGAGKSTLLRLIVGMTRPDAGELRVLGAPVGGEAFRALREDIGYVPDETYFPEMLTPRDVGAVLSRAYSRWTHPRTRRCSSASRCPSASRCASCRAG